jgi:2-oxo-4-hydroxy-4-carboxy--5-ureidoimidazoline (OHCU) decarboxylase
LGGLGNLSVNWMALSMGRIFPKARAAQFTLINETLYKRGFMLPLLKCVSKEEGEYILRQIHERVCGNHSMARVLVHKAV